MKCQMLIQKVEIVQALKHLNLGVHRMYQAGGEAHPLCLCGGRDMTRSFAR